MCSHLPERVAGILKLNGSDDMDMESAMSVLYCGASRPLFHNPLSVPLVNGASCTDQAHTVLAQAPVPAIGVESEWR
jgi:hypothetical protein